MDITSFVIAIASVIAAVAATMTYIQSRSNGRALAQLISETEQELAYELPVPTSLATGKAR